MFTTRLVSLTTLPLLLSAVPACRSVQICVSDAFVMRGGESLLLARVELQRPADSRALAGVPVQFFVDNERLGEVVTDAMGEARLMRPLRSDASEYRAEAHLASKAVSASGRVFNWSGDRTSIVCDIDKTVCMTDYSSLLSADAEDSVSQPYPGAAEALRGLAERFDIIFLTGRPAALHAKTRLWLRRHNFPDAPLITTPRLRDVLLVRRYKVAAIKELQRSIPTLAIGIGNAPSDAAAYGQCGLLTLMIDVLPRDDEGEENRFAPHAVVVRDWKMLVGFFSANRESLENPGRLREIVREEGLLQRPVIRAAPRR